MAGSNDIYVGGSSYNSEISWSISDADGIMTDTTARLEYPSIMDNTTQPLSHADTTDSEVQSGVSIYSKDYKDYFNDDNDGGAAGATPLERRDQWLDTSSFAAPHNRADISQKLPSRESLFTPAAYSTPRPIGRKRPSQFYDLGGRDNSGKMSRQDKSSYDINTDMGFWSTKY